MPYRTLTLQEVAAYLHLEPDDVSTLVRRDAIPCERAGSRLVFRRRDVDAWASQRILGFGAKPLAAYCRAASKRAREKAGMPALLLRGLFRREAIEPRLASRTKPSVLRDMVVLADRTGLVSSPRELLASLQERERLCSTGLADGIALLHPRNHDPYLFVESFLGLGLAPHPIPFGAPDGQPSDLFFLICCQDDRLHLHVLSRLCLLAKQPDFRDTVRAAEDAGALMDKLHRAEDAMVRRMA